MCLKSIGTGFKSPVFGQVMSNGRYKSIEHRAVANKEKDRISIAAFCNPEKETEIGPAGELINESNPCNYRNFKRGDYLASYLLQGKKAINFAKINPSSVNPSSAIHH
jgi:isopenicillin N synthase-like dioxygenase